MSDFKAILTEQLKDPEFQLLWEEGHKLLVEKPVAGATLSEMNLTDEDHKSIAYAAAHPDEFDARIEAIARHHIT